MPAAPITLTEEFERALAILGSGQNLFLTGKAGTGKSTLIRHFMATTDRRVVVAAPTGIAALNVDGYTIHRLFGFGTTTDLAAVLDGSYRPGRFAGTLASLETLVLDEASMVRADLFDMLVAALERFGPRPGSPFGGVQVVLVGDLFQLPPVVVEREKEFFETRYDSPYFFSADRFSRDAFPTVALTTVFRQLGDQRLTGLLNAVREGLLVERARAELNARTDPDFEPPDGEFWLTLAPTNRVVAARNRGRLDRLPGAPVEYLATASGDLSLFDAPVEETVALKVGAQVMLLSNDPADRWANGTLGRVTGLRRDADGPVVDVELRDGSVVAVRPHTWEATRPVVVGGALRREVVGTFTQLPLTLAWAITIHKSQGQTLDRLVVDLRGGVFDFGQVYVALSRCTSLQGLVLTRPVLPKDLKTDRRVVRFLRASTDSGPGERRCALGILTVGAEGRLSRPRPVEIAVAFEDGSAVSTLVNPQRDLDDARAAYGIAVDDVLLAPTLAEAWSAVAPLLEGCTPVGVGVDQVLGLVDFELKRLGSVVPLPVGVEVPPRALTSEDRRALAAPTALARAQAVLRALEREGFDTSGGTAFDSREVDLPTADGPDTRAGQDPARDGRTLDGTYLLTRDSSARSPESAATPTLSALLGTSRVLSEVLLGRDGHAVRASATARALAAEVSADVVRDVVAERLAAAAARTTGLPSSLLDRLRLLEGLVGISVIDTILATTPGGVGVPEVLCVGARVCFTGTAVDEAGRVWTRDEMMAAAASRGLVPVPSVTRSRCDALVVAEVGTQSGKARKAKELEKPVLSAAEFFAWLGAGAVAPLPVP
ncbi:AAA family ATPase [Actinotalea sp.]|uniref:AAA family ATPase n=1 Tax=Actinotalea sp. TaxID=1872145 RepID=UPI0035664DFC